MRCRAWLVWRAWPARHVVELKRMSILAALNAADL
ncbi:hypothetical protein OG2516_15999 [Oceanicola granulosus HTCC2516]|uniref:Uncharacterized protein n=1 Tax=Oceanicola granulosus (strain ATCC BAA-861 / DSM 15982 / KCTC 12143 / HTCC2516) TaxID=314256 RepID=Q2CGW6_OCEGH|nr:hypothetical protein OG2516_15999 [Oceanicola granulosus HTCC2516]